MKLDYDLLKKILQTMVNEKSHLCSSVGLAEKVGLDLEDSESKDKFFGHIRILYDASCVDSENENLGIDRAFGSDFIYYDVNYRLTDEGYEFLDTLNNQTIFNTVKDFSISAAMEVGKELLIKHLMGGGG